MRHSHSISVLALVLAGCSCGPTGVLPNVCASNADCVAGHVCVDSFCRVPADTGGPPSDASRDVGSDTTACGANRPCGATCCAIGEICGTNTMCCARSVLCGSTCCASGQVCEGAVCRID